MVDEKKQPDPIDLEKGYETEDLSIRGMTIFGIGIAVILLVTAGVILLMFNFFDDQNQARQRPMPPQVENLNTAPPAPRIQRLPGEDYARLRARAEADLTSYGWVDEANGVVRIPVEQAMELLLERGLPTRPQSGGGDSEE